MSSISPTMLKNGDRLLINDEVYVVVDASQQAMGRGRGRVTTKLRHIVSGKTLEKTYRSNEQVEIADAEFRDMQYLYFDGDSYVFMDNDSYEQKNAPAEVVGDDANFLKENTIVKAIIFKGNIIAIELPPKMDFVVQNTVDAVKGNTATNVTKDAKIDTGHTVKVPLFIKEGDKVRINTTTGEYVERVN